MKRKQKGEVVMVTAATYMVIAFLTIVTNGFKNPENLTKTAEAPSAVVFHNYNGGFTK